MLNCLLPNPLEWESPSELVKKKNYLYHVTAYDKKGKSCSLLCKSFGQQAKIHVGDYLLIKTKGQAVRHWEIIKKNKVPENIIQVIE